MRVLYSMNDMVLKNKARCIGDMISTLYCKFEYELKEQVEKIRKNESMSAKLVNAIRKQPGFANFSIDTFLFGLESVSDTKVFSFKVNGVSPDVLLSNSKDMELEVYMNPLYFTTKALFYQQLPGFRKKDDFGSVVKREEDLWLRGFEKDLCTLYPKGKLVKSVLEE